MFKRSRDGGMGYLAQEQSVFRKLTVEQNLLAIMELIKESLVEIVQTESFGPIHVKARSE